MKYAIRNRFIKVITEYIQEKLEHNTETIAEAIGITNNKLENLLNKKSFLKSDVASKFLMAYPEVNCEWLLMGWDEMLKKDNDKNINYTFHQNNTQNLEGDGNILSKDSNFDHFNAEKMHTNMMFNAMQKNIKLQEKLIASLTSEVSALKSVLKDEGIE